MPRNESGTSPRKRAAATDLHERLSKDELIKRLKNLAHELSNADQTDATEKYRTVAQSLVSPFILKHRDKDVKAHAACCLADILRIHAPEAPYEEEQLKAVFLMMTNQLKGLGNTKSNLSKKSFYLLESLALVKSFNICLELDFQDIILQLFKVLFQVVNENHSNKIQNFMLDVMCPIIQEGDSIPQELLDTVLVNIVEPQKSENTVAYKLTCEFIKRTASSVEPYLQMFFNSSLALGKTADSSLADNIYDLILELNRICPSVLLSVVPQLEFKLKSEDVEERLSVTELLGQMFSEQDSELATQNKALWNSFLGRFVDISVDVRVECIKRCKEFLKNHPDLVVDISDKLHERQRDPDERVRQEVVITICDAAAENISGVSDQLLNDVCERTRDKKWHVRREAMMCLGKLYKKMTTGATANRTAAKKLSWVPSKLLHCYYLNTPENRLCVERILIGCLVPVSLEADQKMKRLLHIYCKLDEAAVSAFHGILTCQQKVRSDIADLIELSTGEKSQDNETLLFSKIISLARAFPDAFKFQENLKKLRGMIKEATLRELLKTCLNPNVGCSNVFKAVSDVVVKLGSKHPVLETLKALLDRAAPLLVDEQCIKALLKLVKDAIEGLADDEDDDEYEWHESSGVNAVGKKGLALLLGLAGVFPSQFQNDDTFQQLLVFLKNKDQEIVDHSLKMLALTGDGIEKVNKSLANYYHPVLSKLALKGTPCQAKHSLRSIAKISAASSQPFDRVFTNLVSSLSYDCPLLLTTLTALSEIALVAPSLFETQRPTIVRDFVVKELLMKDRGEMADSNGSEGEWCEDRDVTPETQAKVKGIRLLVKWLRGRQGNHKSSVQPVLRLLNSMLTHKGDLQQQGCVKATDCSRLRLAAACGMIKIAQEPHYTEYITLENFQQLSLVMQDPCYEVRDKFTKKLHKAEDVLKLPLEYLGIFALAAPEPVKERKTQVRQMITKNIKTRRDYLKQHSAAQECSHSILPEYALPCVIHMLAHHPDFKQDDHETLVQFRDYLWFFMEPIMAKADNYSFLKKLVENVKETKDAQAPDDEEVNKNLYTVCDLALGLILNKVHTFVLKEFPGNLVLPKRFFVPSEGGSANSKSYLPKGFQFTTVKGQKKGSTVESKSTPSKLSSKTSAKSDKKTPRKTPSKASKSPRSTLKEKVKETPSDKEESSSETSESGFASPPPEEQTSPRKRGRPANSSEKTAAKKSRKASPQKDTKPEKKTSAKQLNLSNKRKNSRQKDASPPKSPHRRSPFVSTEKSSSTAKSLPSPRKGRAAKRLVSELDALPEDGPTPDSGTSSLESPKKPLSTRQISQQSSRTKSKNQVNGVTDESPSKVKRKKDIEESNSSPVKKSKVSEPAPTKRKELALVVKRKISKRR